jgi:hypothetical protein
MKLKHYLGTCAWRAAAFKLTGMFVSHWTQPSNRFCQLDSQINV